MIIVPLNPVAMLQFERFAEGDAVIAVIAGNTVPAAV
jgi:hypothetical protein